jgi:hypothetical protein
MSAMAETNGQVARERVPGKARDTAPGKVTSTTQVNVALPFSKVEVHEPSEHLVALSALVQDMAALLARMAHSPEGDALLSRAEVLAAKLR